MTSALASVEPEQRGGFLAALARAGREPLPFRAVVVVAHPDDETIGCGALLARLPDVTVIQVTDGAPRNGPDATARGFVTPADYAAARRRELEAALALAGVTGAQLASLGWADQSASFHLAEIARELARRLATADVVLTHAYEGGHPDHDATAFAVHAACALLRRSGHSPDIVEMPLYHAGDDDGWAVQRFAAADGPEVVVRLAPDELRLKQAMLAAHTSQADVLRLFDPAAERFRAAPDYDFARLPNNGALLYERQGWGMTGAHWLELAGAALAELGLAP